MSTDTDWDKWGETDPYFGVLSSDEYRAGNLSEEHRAKFFDSGSDYIDRMLATVREHLDSDFEPVSALDFGCGVGRLVIPLANVATTVVGVDVSDHMLAESASNCVQRKVENVSFVKSDDDLTQLQGSFDLIHSCLVLQHIPTKRGMKLIEALLCHLQPGGVVAIQFYYRCDAPKWIRALVKLRYKLPIANMVRNILRGQPWREPAMQLHTYSLEEITSKLKAVGANSIYLHPFAYGEFQSVALYAQKAKESNA